MTLAPAADQAVTRRVYLVLRWLPAFAAAAYLATVAALGSRIVDDVNWDTDASGIFALADRLRGSGPVYLAHAGDWTALWWMLVTRGLPWHEQLWEATGYLFTVIAAVLLGWATSRIAGRWAGVAAAALMVVIAGPFSLRALVSVSAHVFTPVGAVVLGVGLVLLTRTSLVPAICVGIVAGANAASDPLLWFAGVIPFAFAGGLLAWSARRVDIGIRAGVTLGVTVLSALATNVVMHALDFHTVPLDVGLSSLRDLPPNIEHLGRMVALLGGANYAIPGPYPREPLRVILALLVFAAVAAPIVAAVGLTIRRAEPTTWAYAWYWAAVSALLSVVFVVTPNAADLGPKSSNYLLALAPAAGVGVALLASSSPARQVAVGLAIGAIAAINISSIRDGRAEVTGLPIQAYERPLRQLLEHEGVTRGYAGYWDAQNLSWQSGMRLLVAPVANCGDKLCPTRIFTIRSWYEQQGGPSFLLVDPTVNVIHAPPFAARARATHRFGPMTLYIFDYDIARHIRPGPG
jgi:hypothetical protein